MPQPQTGARRRTVEADKTWDASGFIKQARKLNVTPHVGQTGMRGGLAIDPRTTRHAGYGLSLKARKLIEEGFGWAKDIRPLRPKVRGRRKIELAVPPTFTGYSLTRIRKFLAPGFG